MPATPTLLLLLAPLASCTNLYDVLGCTRDASAEQIKAAYRQAALRTHPDRGGAAKDFEAVRTRNRQRAHRGARGCVVRFCP